VILWLLAISIASWLVNMGWDLGLGRTVWALIGLVGTSRFAGIAAILLVSPFLFAFWHATSAP
jgi:hypothetical protein